MSFSFTLIARDPAGSAARLARINTPHGIIETPAFLPCATQAALRGLLPTEAKAAGVSALLGNGYHLMLRPGADIIARHGGLACFMGWQGPTLTDSGGFQIFSLNHGGVAQEIKGHRHLGKTRLPLVKISEEGAEFRSHIDGTRHLLTPERAIMVQRLIGADIILALDECTPYHLDRNSTARAMERTHRWADRCLLTYEQKSHHSRATEGSAGPQILYGICQGGIYPDLRQESADFLCSRPFFGHAIGGTLGIDKPHMLEILTHICSHLSKERPVHLLGIGQVNDIFAAVRLGIDSFDCVHPTRIGRHGWALLPAAMLDRTSWTSDPRINLRHARYRNAEEPLDPSCGCTLCSRFSRAYLHHLFKAGEMLGPMLLTQHNTLFMQRMMQALRESIVAGKLDQASSFWAGL